MILQIFGAGVTRVVIEIVVDGVTAAAGGNAGGGLVGILPLTVDGQVVT